MCISVYIYIYIYKKSPPIKSLDSRGFDSNKLLILRGGNYHIHIIVGSLPESLTQGLLVGKLLVGGLGVISIMNITVCYRSFSIHIIL